MKIYYFKHKETKKLVVYKSDYLHTANAVVATMNLYYHDSDMQLPLPFMMNGVFLYDLHVSALEFLSIKPIEGKISSDKLFNTSFLGLLGVDVVVMGNVVQSDLVLHCAKL